MSNRKGKRSPDITMKKMTVISPTSNNTTQRKSRSIEIDPPKEGNGSFSEQLNASLCPAHPKGASKLKDSFKLNLSHSSSLPKKKRKSDEECLPSKGRSKKQNEQIDIADSELIEDPPDCNFTSENKFAVKQHKPAYKVTINTLETRNSQTKNSSNSVKTELKDGMHPLKFYDKSASPKSYRRLRADTPNPNGRMPPLPILCVPSESSNSEYSIKQFHHKPTDVSSLRRNPIRSINSLKTQNLKMETIDLVESEEMNISPSMNSIETMANPDIVLPTSDHENYEFNPEFSLSYDDDDFDLPPLPTIDEPMEFTDAFRDAIKMDISALYFGSLYCKPLERLEIDKESLKLHIEFRTGGNKFTQLLHIQAQDIESIEIHKVLNSGFILVRPKEESTQQLSVDLNLTPTVYLNYKESELKKQHIAVIFDRRSYPLKDTYSQLNGLFSFPVNLFKSDNYKLIIYDVPMVQSARRSESKSTRKTLDTNHTSIQSIDSPTDSPEKEHSYCDYANNKKKAPDIIQEYYKLIESSNNKLLTYPRSDHPRRITIPKDTLHCLQPEMFLNDTIIEFYLLYINHEIISPKQRDQVHFFNTFFYTKLTDNMKSALSLANMTEKHKLVSKWTKNVNLFEKDFILVPIHDHAHWFLAIICYPYLAGKVPIKPNRDYDEIDTELMEQSKSPRKICRRIPCILIFDSLEIKRIPVINNLRFYLQAEWNARYLSQGDYACTTSNLVVGHHPKLPIQPNSWDCGLFVMQYAESFFQKPLQDFSFPIKLENWFFLDEIKHKRNLVIKLIYDLSRNKNS